MNNSDLDEFEAKLKVHDWTWGMSDDSSQYGKGQDNDAKLRKQAKDLGEKGIALYNAYDESRGYPKNPIK